MSLTPTESLTTPPPARTSGLVLAILLGIAFTLLCSLRVAGGTSGVLGGDAILRSVLKGPFWSTQLARNIALLALVHVALSVAVGVACWLLAHLAEAAWPKAALSRGRWVLCWFVVIAAWILVSNAAHYPWSALGEPYAALVTASWNGVSVYRVATALAAIALTSTAVMGLARFVARTARARMYALVGGSTAGLLLVIMAGTSRLPHAPAQASAAKPNVVVIGIDSLRSDALQSGWGEVLTPNIDAFVGNATVFSDAITPLARTFPSWVATLSGRHPHGTGAIINLLPHAVVDTGETLPQTLRSAGYRTVYATDEVRFSNIDASFGFDQVIAPPMGASDFLIGTLNDIPLSNLLVNTWLGRWLFPNQHANRAAAVTYEPDTFVSRFAAELRTGSPSFIAVHLTLPHWPYYWATAPSRESNSNSELRNLYTTALRQADQQFAGIVATLRERGVLQNAIVLVMSDHGESVGRPDDSPYVSIESGQRMSVLNGHGTSVMAPHQYRVVMALGSFGGSPDVIAPGLRLDAPVSLVDVAPTLLELLKVPATQQFDGMSLVPLLTTTSTESTRAALLQRIRFTESEFNPRGLQPGTAVTGSALEEAMSFYEIDPDSDRISVKPDRIPKLLRERQYAALKGNRLLAAIPAGDREGFDLLLVDLEAMTYVRLDEAPGARAEDAAELLAALRDRFGIRQSSAGGSFIVSPTAARN